MSTVLAQLILAGRGEDSEGWMNILFVVVLAVFWVISGIVKATAKRPKDSRQQQPSRQPVRRISRPATAPDPSSARPTSPQQARAQAGPAAAATAQAQPRPRSAELIAELEKALRSDSPPASPKPALPLPTPQVEPALQEPPDLSTKPLKELERMRLTAPKGTPQEDEGLPELEFDFADPDELSKAILHYEILGPPVSLRDPSHQNIGF